MMLLSNVINISEYIVAFVNIREYILELSIYPGIDELQLYAEEQTCRAKE